MIRGQSDQCHPADDHEEGLDRTERPPGAPTLSVTSGRSKSDRRSGKCSPTTDPIRSDPIRSYHIIGPNPQPPSRSDGARSAAAAGPDQRPAARPDRHVARSDCAGLAAGRATPPGTCDSGTVGPYARGRSASLPCRTDIT
eukprot:765289-Hanusia_phi.AAC.2